MGGGADLHGADLHGGSVGAKKPAIGQVKGVGLVPRRMIGRGVERIEAMPFVFDVGAFREGESHPAKESDRAVEHLGERMKRADLVRRAGQGNVDLGERACFLRRAQLFAGLLERGGHGGPDLVEQLADDRPLFFRERFHLLAPGGNAAAASEVADPRGVQRLFVRRSADLGEGRVAQFFERVRHGVDASLCEA